jgi:hypothetical protein
MLTQSMNFNTLTIAEKVKLVAVVLLVTLSLLAVVAFASLSAISLVTRRISHYWNACFLLCSFALGGWMIFYAGLMRLGGGVMFFRNNVLLFWFLVLTVLVSAVLRFAGPHRYIAIFVLALGLVVFHVAVPGFLNSIWLVRQR